MNTKNTENRFYDLNDEEALTMVLQQIRGRVKRSVTPADVHAAIERAEEICKSLDIFMNAREARDIHITVNPERNRQPKARSYNGRAMAVEIVLRWCTRKNTWYVDLDASGGDAALSDTRINRWDSQVVIPDANIDVEQFLAQAGISLGDHRLQAVKVGA